MSLILFTMMKSVFFLINAKSEYSYWTTHALTCSERSGLQSHRKSSSFTPYDNQYDSIADCNNQGRKKKSRQRNQSKIKLKMKYSELSFLKNTDVSFYFFTPYFSYCHHDIWSLYKAL